jgi:hypothetical protein
MIITERLTARAALDTMLLQRHEDEVVGAFATRAARTIVSMAEGIGAFARPESIWVYRDGERQETGQTYYAADWCPDPTSGVEFIGGEWDGDIRPVPRETVTGRPAERVVLASQPQPAMLDGTITPQVTRHPSYQLAGINSITDRWVYKETGHAN